MSVLKRVDYPADLKRLSLSELRDLAREIREFIVRGVSQTGGHLASSLGVVELTLALHYVFNTPEDQILWDVGHQAYAHKIITGRKQRFETLRQFEGLKPFISPSESPYDAFVAGHAGNAVSAASGIYEGLKRAGRSARTIAVIGDGSLSNGMTFEGLNYVGSRGQNLLVILNDNNMFISEKVGAMADYLSRMMTSKPVWSATRRLKRLLRAVPRYGERLYRMAKYVESAIKGVVNEGMIFEEMGFRYVGPIDGHNLAHLIQTLENIKHMDGPIFLHVITQKGRGYQPAMQNPEDFHGVGKFKPENGETGARPETYSDAFGQSLLELARADERVVALSAAMCSGTGLKTFKDSLPARFYDVGIAESHAVTMAAGMAAQGLRPVVAIYSTFMQRAYDQIVHDVALPKLPVVLAIDRAGLVGADGPTHHGAFDIQFLRAIPNLTVMAPRDQLMLGRMLELGLSLDGPSAIRYPRAEIEARPLKSRSLAAGKAEVLRNGQRAVVFCLGPLCYAALTAVPEDVAVVDLRFAKPLDRKTVRSLVAQCDGRFVVVEEGVMAGGAGEAVLEALAGLDLKLDYRLLGLPDRFVEHGAQAKLMDKLGLNAAGIRRALDEIL
ncbi:MAG: 1-deoxy-D-xylulose-5-phosphate synthase [Deltaproteobacteria bacterium ADurb.Bin510]|nr:MAG: 1-deoxy-D-xylulose-5-phosphate synthase [Deltaproteobacteria bacterium ADurb.Bin510]